jgi:mevalonate kinase
MRPLGLGHAKVILFGEHAAVHGEPALAAALGLTTRVVHVAHADQTRVVILPWDHLRVSPDDGTPLGQALAHILRVVSERLQPPPPVEITLDTDIPSGAGLGSSAAWAVAVAQQLCALADPHASSPHAPVILAAADASERVFHGNPSGVDHTTSAMGGILRFQKNRPLQPLDLPPIPLIVAQVEPGADTGRMVAGVQRLLHAHPAAVQPLLTSLGALTLAAQDLLSVPPPAAPDLPALGALMDIAHGVLAALGVSTPKLDAASHAARQAGAFGAKLTGAGGGGCMIALCSDEQAPRILHALQGIGARPALYTLAGVRRHDLAL